MPVPKRMKAAMAAERSLRAKYRHKGPGRDNRDPETVARQGRMGGGDCWCGQPYPHDWEGKADGAPHPPGPG